MERASARLAGLGRDLFEQAGAGLSELRLRVELAARGLETTSPFAVLERGYSITRDAEGRALRSAGDAREGMEIETVLAEGAVRSKVTSVQAGGSA
jgi:exodeoxyribonuclease VII large subunit